MKKLAKLPGGSFRGTIPNLTEGQMRAVQNVQDFMGNSPVNMDGTPKKPEPGVVQRAVSSTRDRAAAVARDAEVAYRDFRHNVDPYIFGNQGYIDAADWLGAEKDYNESDYQAHLRRRGALNRDSWQKENASPNPLSRALYVGFGGSYDRDYADYLAQRNALSRKDWHKQNGTDGYSSTPKERVKRRLADLATQEADRQVRERLGLRKGVPSTEALNDLAKLIPAEDIIAGRHEPGVAPRDRYGNIMPASYPRRIEGRTSYSKYVLPNHERGIVPNSDFEGPPQPNIGLTPEFQDRLKSLTSTFSGRYAGGEPSLPGASRDIFAGLRDSIYLPGAMMDDMEDRRKAFGERMGFNSQTEFDDHYYQLAQNELWRRGELAKEKDRQQLVTAGNIALSAIPGAGLGRLALTRPWLAAGLGLGTSMGAHAYKAGKGVLRDYLAYNGDGSLGSLTDKESWKLHSRGGLDPEQSIEQYLQQVMAGDSKASQDFRRAAAQAAYSAYEEGKPAEAYKRMRDLYLHTTGGFASAPTAEAKSTGFVDSAGRTLSDIDRFNGHVDDLQRGRGEKKSPFAAGVKGLLYAGMSDSEAALIKRQLEDRDITLGDFGTLGLDLGGRAIQELPNYLMNHKLETLSALAPALTAVGGPIIGASAEATRRAHAAARGLHTTHAAYDHLTPDRYEDVIRQPMSESSATNLMLLPAVKGLLSEAGMAALTNNRRTSIGDTVNAMIDRKVVPPIQEAISNSGIVTGGRDTYATPEQITPGAKTYWEATKPARDSLRRATTSLDGSAGTAGKALAAYRMGKPYLEPSDARVLTEDSHPQGNTGKTVETPTMTQ